MIPPGSNFRRIAHLTTKHFLNVWLHPAGHVMTVHRNTAIGDSRRAGQSSSRLLIRAGASARTIWVCLGCSLAIRTMTTCKRWR